MISSYPQDEVNKNLNYRLKKPLTSITYHSGHVPFGWPGIRPVVRFQALKE